MKQLTILFIDDDEIERMKFKRICEQSSYKPVITEARNGEEAIVELKKSVPNVIVLDLNMPKMNGIEFLKTLKSDTVLKYVPIVVLSSSNNHNDVKKCYEIGIAGYMIKALRYEDYNKRINTMLAYWSTNQLIHNNL